MKTFTPALTNDTGAADLPTVTARSSLSSGTCSNSGSVGRTMLVSIPKRGCCKALVPRRAVQHPCWGSRWKPSFPSPRLLDKFMPKRKTRFSKDANYWQRLNSVIRNESSPSMPGIVPACQGKLTVPSSIKTGISALGNDSTIQGLQHFFFQRIAAKHTVLNEQQKFFYLHIHVSTFGGNCYEKGNSTAQPWPAPRGQLWIWSSRIWLGRSVCGSSTHQKTSDLFSALP